MDWYSYRILTCLARRDMLGTTKNKNPIVERLIILVWYCSEGYSSRQPNSSNNYSKLHVPCTLIMQQTLSLAL
jgi:hypothetical protein